MSSNKLKVAQANSDHWAPPKIHAMEYRYDFIYGKTWMPICTTHKYYSQSPVDCHKRDLTTTVTCKHCLKQLEKRGIK